MARILKLSELKPHMVVWLQESHMESPHITEIVSIKKGENYFDQKCMEVDFSIPFTRLFTFLPPGDDYDDYGNTWLCWDSKPSKKEMRKAMENWDSYDRYEEN